MGVYRNMASLRPLSRANLEIMSWTGALVALHGSRRSFPGWGWNLLDGTTDDFLIAHSFRDGQHAVVGKKWKHCKF